MAVPARLLIHVGYPKTATTTLQRGLFQKSSSILYLGKPFASEKAQSLEKGLVLGGDLYARELKQRHRLLEQIDAGSRRTVLMSHEGFLRNTRYGGGREQEGHDIRSTATRLYDYFEPVAEALGTSAQVIITLRSQFDLLPSYHSYFVPEYSWREYLNDCVAKPQRGFAKVLDYARVLDMYCRIFGGENVHVMLYEEFVRDPQRFLDRLCGWLGIEEPALRDEVCQSKLNASTTTAGGYLRKSRLARRIEKYSAGSRLLARAEQTLPRGLWSALALERSPKPTSQQRALITAAYGTSNAAASSRYGLRLQSYGYP